MRKSLTLALIWMAGTCWGQERAALLSTYTWHAEAEGFGGLSALELSDDGQRFTVLSDRARIGTGTITRHKDAITAVALHQFHQMLDTQGQPIADGQSDSEGIAIRPDGRLYVSFEGVHRVWTYARVGGKAAGLPRHAQFRHLHSNASLEALARDDRGWLYTIPESPRGAEFPVFRYRNGVWETPFTIPAHNGFEVVGADVGPDGRFYLLERRFSLLSGFTSRLRRFDLSPDRMDAEVTLFQSAAFQHDNLEGIAVWRAPGGLRATMVSDDNFRALQRTEIVEYALPE